MKFHKRRSRHDITLLLALLELLTIGVFSLTPLASQAPVRNASVMEFVSIPPGEFQMGCSPEDGPCYSDEKPMHTVRISRSFELGKYEVTQAQWKAVTGKSPSRFRGDNRPVETVSWDDVQEFLKKQNSRNDGYAYRMPTEAEWEYAARAGRRGAPGSLETLAWLDQNSGNQTHDVGQKLPNAWGLYDMFGNVWEWVEDWYEEGYYAQSSGMDPHGPAKGVRRVLRGGSWIYLPKYSRASVRFFNIPSLHYDDLGFRCAREKIK